MLSRNGRPILSRYLDVLKESFTEIPTTTYIKKKFKWNDDHINDIEWENFQPSIQNRILCDRIRTIKNIFVWENIGTQRERILGVNTECPVCKSTKETNDHMFICSKQQNHKEWAICERTLQNIHTIPPIIISLKCLLLKIKSPDL